MSFGGMVCQVTQRDVMEYLVKGSKPDWCPIKPMPERANHEGYCDNGRYDKGWNDCLAELMKDGE